MAHPTGRAAVPLAPVVETVRVLAIAPIDGGLRIRAMVVVDPANPIFAGHYPGLPVFPGVCQLECAHRTVLYAAPRKGVWPILDSVLSARFLRMVSPGDQLDIETEITEDGPWWTATAVLTSAQAATAKFVLRYGLPGIGGEGAG